MCSLTLTHGLIRFGFFSDIIFFVILLVKLTDILFFFFQFTLLQNGCRQKLNFGKKRAYLEISSEYTIGTADQGNVLCKEEIKNSGDKAFTRTLTRNSLGHEYPAQCTAGTSLFIHPLTYT